MRQLLFIQQLAKQPFSIMAIVLLLPITRSPGQGSWTQIGDMPVLKTHHASAAYNGKIYLFGGTANFSTCTNEVYEFDPATDTYTPKTPMPVTNCGMAAAETGGKIYVFGGSSAFIGTASNLAFEYDIANNSWSPVANMPTARLYPAASVLEGKIYVTGGGNSYGISATDVVEVYDPVAKVWSSAPPMIEERGSHTSHVVNGKIYVFGGSKGANPDPVVEETVEMYDPVTGGNWTVVDTMPTPRFFYGSSQIGGKIFVMGGMNATGGPFSSVEMYDPVQDKWKTDVTSMLAPRRAFSNSDVGGKIYVFGGNNTTVLKSVEVFDPGNLVSVSENAGVEGIRLEQNSPNPFSDVTYISFTITEGEHVDLSVFDMKGRNLVIFVNEFLPPGTYVYRLNASKLESGVFFYRLQVGEYAPEVRKMVVMR